MTAVVAALIWADDRFLICQRPAHKAQGLLWEFPGGKVEPGETPEQALVRECCEELGVTLAVGSLFVEVVHQYPDLTVRLAIYHAVIASGQLERKEHKAIEWIRATEAEDYVFCPADRPVVARLLAGQTACGADMLT